MKIKAYLKPQCGWSMGVRAIMEKYALVYDDLDIINNRDIYEEMVTKSGQPLSPCVEIDGVMLIDVSGEEVENYLLSNKLVNESQTDIQYPLIRLAPMKNMKPCVSKIPVLHLSDCFKYDLCSNENALTVNSQAAFPFAQ